MGDASQVEIRQRPVSWKFSRDEFGPTKVFYDDYHNEVVLVTEHFICKSHRASAKLSKFNISLPKHTELRQVKFSRNNQLIAVQNSPLELKVIDTRGNIMAIQQCRGVARDNAIHDLHWIDSDFGDLCVVTRFGVEFYKVQPHVRDMAIIKRLKYETRRHWFAHASQFLMLANSEHIFLGLRIGRSRIVKVRKFEILGVQRSDASLVDRDFFDHISLVEFAHDVGCVYLDRKKAKVYVFCVRESQMILYHSFNLYSKGKYAVFQVDNVLVAYNRDTEVPILLDFEGKNYASAPLPIRIRYSEGSRSVNRVFRTKDPKFRFVWPFVILEVWNERVSADSPSFDLGNAYTLSINVDCIVNCWGPERPLELLDFVLRRSVAESRRVALSMVDSMVRHYCEGFRQDASAEMELISAYLTRINEVLLSAIRQGAHSSRGAAVAMMRKGKSTSDAIHLSKKPSSTKSSSSKRLGALSATFGKSVTKSMSFSTDSEEVSETSTVALKRARTGLDVRRIPKRSAPRVERKKTKDRMTVISAIELIDGIFVAIFDKLKRIRAEVVELEDGSDFLVTLSDTSTTTKKASASTESHAFASLSPLQQFEKVAERFCAVLLEYTRCMHRNRLKVPTRASLLIVELLRDADELYKLHQLFQYHAFVDDYKLAMALLQMALQPSDKKGGGPETDELIEDLTTNALLPAVDPKYKAVAPYRPCLQLALDMLIRLNLWSKAVKVALIYDEVETALTLFLAKFNAESNTDRVTLSIIFDYAYRSDPVVFFRMYQFCKHSLKDERFAEEMAVFSKKYDLLEQQFLS